jgi:hypothetical protein
MGTLLGSRYVAVISWQTDWGSERLTTLTAYHRMIAKTENEALIHVSRRHQAGAPVPRVLGRAQAASTAGAGGRGALSAGH